MIKTIFPINILVKDFDMDPKWNEAIEQAVNTYFVQLLAETGENRNHIAEIPMELFSEENMEVTPELRELQKMFIDGFYELYLSYPKDRYDSVYGEKLLTYDDIKTMAQKDLGRLPFMKKGDTKFIHNHTRCEAFGIFYLSDVDNDKDGGQLILHDPSFHHLIDFYDSHTARIETKKNRLVIVPAHVWHQVSQYIGDKERMTIVMNLEHFQD